MRYPKSLANRLRSVLRLAWRTGDWQTALELSRLNVDAWHIRRGPCGPWVEPLGMTLDDARRWPWALANLERVNALKTGANAAFKVEAGGLVVELQGLKLPPTSGEELFTLDELFVQKVYGFDPPGPVVMMDIGMNVGYASLMFAARPDVAAVYGYEPFPATFEQARRAFGMNPVCARKIRAENFGLGAGGGKVVAEYSPELKGSAGLFRGPRTYSPGVSFDRETIQLRPAVQAFDEVAEAHPGEAIIAKIDCEGAEYEIIGALAAAGRLARLSAVMLEWHRFAEGQEPEVLTRHLKDAGFLVFAPGGQSGVAGMMYAARTRPERSGAHAPV